MKKKTSLKKVGKTGKANIEARKRISEIAEEKGLNYCELRFNGCMGNWTLAPAHKHRRSWYQGDADKLSDFEEWIVACVTCHDFLDNKMTDEEVNEIFERLR